MSRKILALDLDGTLTDSNKEITPRTKEMIAKMQEQVISLCWQVEDRLRVFKG